MREFVSGCWGCLAVGIVVALVALPTVLLLKFLLF